MSTDALLEEKLALAAEWVHEASALLITAGAGMGVDSGLPDFRGNEGFWKAYPALAHTDLQFTQIASPTAFHLWPETAWGFYGHRLGLYRETVPHAGFALLKRWSKGMAGGAFIFTSNVDGQFQKAGFAEERIHECHGSIHWLQCVRACTEDIWPAEGFEPEVDEQQCRITNAMPRCPHCGDLARPNVLMFGDGPWINRRSEVQSQRMEAWLKQNRMPLIIEMGAGTAIPTVRMHGEHLMKRGSRLIRINVREPQVETELGESAISLPLGAKEALERIEGYLSRLQDGRPIAEQVQAPPPAASGEARVSRLFGKPIKTFLDMDLGMVGFKEEKEAFRVRLDASPLLELIEAAQNVHRVYELFLIQRLGDVLDYVHVIPEVLPKDAKGRLEFARKWVQPKLKSLPHPWPEGKVPFHEFDQRFRDSWDAEAVDMAWDNESTRRLVQDFARPLLAQVRAAQGALDDGDPLTGAIIGHIRAGTHPFDRLDRATAIQRGRGYPPKQGGVPQGFYDKLQEMLMDERIQSVTYRSQGDYRVLVMMAREQQRRARLSGKAPEQAFALHASTDLKIGNEAWCSRIWFHDEGVGEGDLFIDDVGSKTGLPIKYQLQVEFYKMGSFILLGWDDGDLPGYGKETGEGWVLYTKAEP